MSVLHLPKSTGAAIPLTLRLWAMPFVTALLILADLMWVGMDGAGMTIIAATAIVIAGIPHGTLDAEIAALHFGQTNMSGKAKIIAVYLVCASAMIMLWAVAPEIALVLFLVMSIVHFSRDWRGGAEPFLAMMVGWALVALPALSHPQHVAAIFQTLTGNSNGTVIAALLACASIPAVLGSLVFAYWAYINDDLHTTIEVVACIVAALFLPPLIAFAVFFCGLHSPRHMADALIASGPMPKLKKLLICGAVSALSSALGVLIYIGAGAESIDASIIRTAFVLISSLTLPHFILEHFTSKRASDVSAAL